MFIVLLLKKSEKLRRSGIADSHFALTEPQVVAVFLYKYFVTTGRELLSRRRCLIMADEKPISASTPEGADLTPTELAQSIIESLVDHTRIVSDLIALMAQALDQDTTKALTLTPQWQAYLESRRQMEQTREDVEKFVALVAPPKSN